MNATTVDRVSESKVKLLQTLYGILEDKNVLITDDTRLAVSRVSRGLITFEEFTDEVGVSFDEFMMEVERRMSGDDAMGDC